MKVLSKTMRQNREYNKRLGFESIRSKYESCKSRMTVSNVDSVNNEFMNYNLRVKVDSGIRTTHLNRYERKWIQEVNEIKKKIK